MSELMIDSEDSEPGPLPASSSPRLSAHEWLLLLVLAAVQFNHIVDFIIVMPLGPVYGKEMGLTPGQFGGVVAAYTISAALANLLAALFIDRFDRKRALLTAFTGFTAGTFLCAIAPDFVLLLGARIVAGAFGGVASGLVLAIVGDVFPDSRRGMAMGVVMSAFSVASSLGLPMGLLLAGYLGWRAPFAVLAGISAVALVVAATVLPSMRGHLRNDRRAASLTIAAGDRLRGLGGLLTNANHLRAFALMVAIMFTSFLTGPYMMTFLVCNVGIQQDHLLFIYLAGGIATILTTTPVGWLSDRFGKLNVFRVMALSTAVPILLVTHLPAGIGLGAVLVLTTVMMVTMSGRMVPAMAMITASAVPQERGGFMSLNTAVQHMAAGVATAVGAMLLTQAAPDQPLVGYALGGWLSCGAVLVCLYLAGKLRPATETTRVAEVEGDEASGSECVAALEEG
jgi:predicted MFS family arabinose efflux permease